MLMTTKTKTTYKLKKKNLFTMLVIIFLGIILIMGALKGISLFKDYTATKNIKEKIKEEIEVKNIVDDELTKTIKPDSTLSKFDAYWDYIKQGLIEIDMAKLKRTNTESIGYMEVKGTDFSYPIIQGANDYYKNHSFDKTENSFGWLYMDENNALEELDTNTIIYGNKNYLGLLISDLNATLKDEWAADDDNYLIKFYTNEHSTLWQIISIYKTKDKDHLKTIFESEEELETYIDSMLKKTEIKFKGYAKTTDRFLTLTTNSNGTNLVIQAKLIKIRTER